MTDPVELDEQRYNSGMSEMYYEELDERAKAVADTEIHTPGEVANASDYPAFYHQLTLALTATNNDERLSWLATIRDAVHARIASDARESLRLSDMMDDEP